MTPSGASDERLEEIATRLDGVRHYPLATHEIAASLSQIDARSFEAGMLGTDIAGHMTMQKIGDAVQVVVTHR